MKNNIGVSVYLFYWVYMRIRIWQNLYVFGREKIMKIPGAQRTCLVWPDPPVTPWWWQVSYHHCHHCHCHCHHWLDNTKPCLPGGWKELQPAQTRVQPKTDRPYRKQVSCQQLFVTWLDIKLILVRTSQTLFKYSRTDHEVQNPHQHWDAIIRK